MSRPVVSQGEGLHGVLVVDKPARITSARVVAVAKGRLGVKVGHTGTLDPMATGVLPLCIGEGTKIAGYLLTQDKAYDGELELGVETNTLDAEGEVVARNETAAKTITEDQLRQGMVDFTGDIMQTPPMFSALKHKGRRLHALARAGEQVVREPRPIRIDSFELVEYTPPRARFRVACSKGTYVRSLVADIGRVLGCGAHLTSLRRTRSGQFTLEGAIPPDEITVALARRLLVSPAQAIAHLPGYTVSAEKLPAVANGQRLPWPEIAGESPEPTGTCRLLTPSLELVALVRVEEGRLRFNRVFTYALT